jgi:hypothetical protein
MSKQTDLINIPDAITVSGSNVGIGTSSPAVALEIIGTTTSGIKIKTNSAHSNGFNLYWDSSVDNVVFNNPFSGAMLFETANTERMRIDSSGNVGIGTSSIASGGAGTTNLNLHTPSATSVYLKLSNASTGNTASDGFDLSQDASGNAYIINRENGFLNFWTNTTERMRIDSSGNFLVGKTSTGGNVAGHQFNSNGAGYITRDGASVLHVNRKTSDGEIISIRKNDVAVGSIGVVSDDRMYFATADGLGLQFDKDNNRIIPCDASGGYNSNVELGDEGLAFTNLFLTGGIQFDSRSNKLDDYEEGTWTPLAKGTSTNPTVAPTLIGRYTKIGNQVNIYLKFDAKSFAGASGGVYFDGLPFSASGATVHGIGSIMQYNVCTFNDSPCLYVSGSAVYIYHNVSGGTWDNSAHTGSSAVYMNACVTYTTNS